MRRFAILATTIAIGGGALALSAQSDAQPYGWGMMGSGRRSAHYGYGPGMMYGYGDSYAPGMMYGWNGAYGRSR